MTRRRTIVRMAGIGVSVMVVFSASPPSGHADTAPPAPAATTSGAATTAVTLNGEGADDPAAELTTWQNDLFGANGSLNLDYIKSGGFRARQDLLSGATDYAISGVPFTPDELAKLPSGSASFIDAPVMASGLGVLVTPPFNNQPAAASGPQGFGWGILTVKEDGTQSYQPYISPLRVPTANLAAMILHYGGLQPNTTTPYNQWNNPNIVKAFGLTTMPPDGNGNEVDFLPSGAPANPFPYLRSDPSETDYYSELLAASGAPAVWQGLQKDFRSTFTVGDALPPTLSTVSTAQGLLSQLDKLNPLDIKGALLLPQSGAGAGGILAAVPPSGLALLKQRAPTNPAQWISVQNANGDWLTPSPASIEAAVNAGGDTALYGFNHSVAGAYPLTYVNHLYAPAHGLSVDKTEALATVIRYLATDGQGAMEASGDGKLSTPLASRALSAANQLVLSNCTGAGASLVVSADPGRLAPGLPGLKAIGSMLHCNPTAAPAAPGVGSAGAAPSSGVIPAASGLIPTSSADASAPGGSAASTGGAAGPGPGPAGAAGAKGGAKSPKSEGALTLASLPIGLPFAGGASFDRFAALIIGAAFFFLGRRAVAWLARLTRL